MKRRGVTAGRRANDPSIAWVALLASTVFLAGSLRLSAAEPDFVLTDDFQTDTRQAYDAQGEVVWSQGSLSLAANSTFGRKVAVTSPVEVEISLERAAGPGEQLTGIYLWLAYGTTQALSIQLHEPAPAERKSREIRIVRLEKTADGQVRGAVIRSFAIKDIPEKATWTIRYRYGLVELLHRQQRVAVAFHAGEYLGALNYVGVSQKGRPAVCHGLTIKGPPSHPITAAQRKALVELAAGSARVTQLNEQADFTAALEHAQGSVDLARDTVGENHPSYVLALSSRATTLGLAGDHHAIKAFDETVEQAERVFGREHPETVRWQSMVANMRCERGDRAVGLAQLARAAQTSRVVQGARSRPTAVLEQELGYMYAEGGKGEEGLALLLESQETLRQLDDRPAAQIRLACVISDLQMRYGRFDDAARQLSRANQLLQQHPPDTALAAVDLWRRMATCQRQQGHADAARATLDRAAQELDRIAGDTSLNFVVPSTLGDSHMFVAGEFADQERYADAIRVFEQGRAAYLRYYDEFYPNVARLDNMRGDAYLAQSLYAEARTWYERSLSLQLIRARRYFGVLAESESLAFADRTLKARNALLHVLSKMSVPAEAAYRTVFDSKGIVTAMIAARAAAVTSASDDPRIQQLANDLERTRRKIAALSLNPRRASTTLGAKEDFDALAARKESLERELAQRTGREQLSAPADADVSKLLSKLPEGVAIVDLVEDDTAYQKHMGYEAFVLRRDLDGFPRVHWIRIPDASAIASAVEQWRAAIRRGRGGPADPAARTLRKLVWEPLETHLGPCRTVVLLPDGPLTRVPWCALPGAEPDSYLIDQYQIIDAAYAQQVFDLLERAAPQGENLLAVGGVEYGEAAAGTGNTTETQPPKWRYLPATKTEVALIAEAWKDAHQNHKPTVLDGAHAQKLAIQAALPQARWVLLATHGFFTAADAPTLTSDARPAMALAPRDPRLAFLQLEQRGRNPLSLSGVVLAGANHVADLEIVKDASADNGVLTAEEIVGLNLRNTELVTLSACESGLGEVAGGEGVFGLKRAFMLAGARSVVASLWQVPDAATGALMQRFHNNIWTGKMPKGAALREAQLWLLREGKQNPDLVRGLTVNKPPDTQPPDASSRLSPFYWAAFQLSGDWR